MTDIIVKTKPHVAHNSGNNEWYTPPKIIESARLVMGDIDLDPASSEIANQRVAAKKIYTLQDNGLTMPWFGRVWLNPPYARPLLKHFTETFAEKYSKKEFHEACVLVNNATETSWFSTLADLSSALCFLKGRVCFLTPEGKTGQPLQGQVVLYYGEKKQKFVDVFFNLGFCVTKTR